MLVRARVFALFATDVIVVRSHVPALVHALALHPIAGGGTMLRDSRTHTAQGAFSVVAALPRETSTVPHVLVPGPRTEGLTVFRPGGDRRATSVEAQDMVADDAVAPEAIQFVQVVRVRLPLHALVPVLVRALVRVPAHDLRLILRTRGTPEADLGLGQSVEAEEATVGMISEIADPGHQNSISVNMTSSYSTLGVDNYWYPLRRRAVSRSRQRSRRQATVYVHSE